MNRNLTYYLTKPLLIKRIAVLMVICYILNPIGPLLNDMLHTISHQFDLPDYVISHSDIHSKQIVEEHPYQEHRRAVVDHDHPLVDLIQVLVDASERNEEKNNSDSFVVEIDKHLNVYKYSIPGQYDGIRYATFFNKHQNLITGYPSLLLRPPIVNSFCV